MTADEEDVIIASDANTGMTAAIGACADLLGVPASPRAICTPVWP